MPLTERASAKINLTLRVTGRRADGYHTLESLVAFADLSDELTLEPGESSLQVTGEFAAASGASADNLVLKAEAALRAQLGGVKSGRFTLTKNLPVAAGLGGGSADAAAALRLLAKHNGVVLDDRRLMDAARQVGADVAVCLQSKPRIMRGVGDDLGLPLALPRLHTVLVNPGVAVATKDVFAAFDRRTASAANVTDLPSQREALLAWLASFRNDLTDAACVRAPVIHDVLAALSSLPGCRLARMSGSGATCFALFDDADEASDAAVSLAKLQPKWWVRATVLR
ncbi:MAG: 4-(cytidine 5'-diphospho)-2-C-methyl-D-erythritol kinase [Pseudolabrys sp.]|nr:4-(cytidine 5'-diphospho)-2-C-methyl-D-erythritol kinase [Pseudolabrys sp.]